MQVYLRESHECEYTGRFRRVEGSRRQGFICEICGQQHWNISLSADIAISESVKYADGIAFNAIIRKEIIKSYELYGRRCRWKSVVLENHMTAHVHRKCCFVFLSRCRFKCVIRCEHLCFVGFLHLSVIFHVLFHGTELLSRGRGTPKDLSIVTPKA